ncbi:MAG: MAPEG family protein [Bdellovibrionales bacterium]|nr:MAPEG family protein [Bdellovibrionales bacterium]
MNPHLIYYPSFALLILSFGVLLRMFVLRKNAIATKQVDYRYFKTYNMADNLPIDMLAAGRHFTNLFEVPTLFYMVSLFALVTNHVDTVMLTLAWIYVGFRYVHSFIHLTSNKILPRMMSYFFSWIALMSMGLVLLVRISYGS